MARLIIVMAYGLNSLNRVQWFPPFLELEAQRSASHPQFTFSSIHRIGYIRHSHRIDSPVYRIYVAVLHRLGLLAIHHERAPFTDHMVWRGRRRNMEILRSGFNLLHTRTRRHCKGMLPLDRLICPLMQLLFFCLGGAHTTQQGTQGNTYNMFHYSLRRVITLYT